MDKKRKLLLGVIITIMVLLIGFLIYYVTSSVISYVNISKNSKRIVSEFNELYESSEIEVILFASPTCNFCKKFVPILDEIKKEEKIDYYYLNVLNLTKGDLNKILEKINANFKGIPHLIILKNKKIIGEISGFTEKEKVLELLEKTEVIKGDV